MLDIPAELSPPVPVPRAEALGPISLLRVLANNPLEAWTSAHFEQPIVMGGLSVGRFAIQEASIMVGTIMRHFTLEMVSGSTPWPVQKVTLRPKGGLPMIVRRR